MVTARFFWARTLSFRIWCSVLCYIVPMLVISYRFVRTLSPFLQGDLWHWTHKNLACLRQGVGKCRNLGTSFRGTNHVFLRHNLCWSTTKWSFWGISVTFWGKNAISFGKMLKCISLWYKCLIYGYVSRSDSQMFIPEGQVPHFLGTSASYWGISISFRCASLWALVSLFEARV